MHFKDNQTLNLRVVDPIADKGVWAIKDDGCNRCCHGEVRRQYAETKMKVLGLQPIWLHKKGYYIQWRWNEHDKWKVARCPVRTCDVADDFLFESLAPRGASDLEPLWLRIQHYQPS